MRGFAVTRKKILYISLSFFIISVFSVAFIYSSKLFSGAYNAPDKAQRPEALLGEAFRRSGAGLTQIQINSWTIADIKSNEKEAARAYFEECLQRLPVKEKLQIKAYPSSEKNENISFMAEGVIGEGVVARFSLVPGEHGQSLVLSLAGQDEKARNILTVNRAASMLAAMPQTEDLNTIKNNTSLIYMGYLKGNLDEKMMKDKAGDVMAFLNSNKVETMVNDRVVSVSGYTPKLSERLTVSGKSVNINMAFRYNGIKNETLVYLGTPIITSEY